MGWMSVALNATRGVCDILTVCGIPGVGILKACLEAATLLGLGEESSLRKIEKKLDKLNFQQLKGTVV